MCITTSMNAISLYVPFLANCLVGNSSALNVFIKQHIFILTKDKNFSSISKRSS